MKETKEAEINEEININEILKVEQSPKIFEDLEKIGVYLDKTLEGIEDIKCTEKNKQEVKKKRALINNTKTLLENKRKEIKHLINEPYEIIEKKYNEVVKSKLDNAISKLDEKTSAIEKEQKNQIKEMCVSYFNEYAQSKDIDFVKFEQMNLKIVLGLATEKGVLKKKTQDDIAQFIDQRVRDINTIKGLEHSDEMIIEYKKNLSCSDSIAIVMDRYKQLELIKQERDVKKEKEINDEVMLNKIDEVLATPKIENNQEYESQEELIAIAFRVIGTKSQLENYVKDFIKDIEERGLRYEQC